MTRKFKYLFLALFVAGLLLILSPSKSNADEIPMVQVSPSDQIIFDTSTVTLITIESKIDSATSTLQSVGQNDGNAIIASIQSNVPNTDTSTALSIATTQEPIATAVLDAGVKVQQAYSAIDSATVALQIAQDAQIAVDSQTSIVNSLSTDLNNAQTDLTLKTSLVDSQTAIVNQDSITVSEAQAAADSSTVTITTNGITATVWNTGSRDTAYIETLNPFKTITVPQITYNWGNGSVLGANSDNVVIKFTGSITVPQDAQTVRYAVYTDDGTRLYIDNQLAIDNWRDQSPNWSPYSNPYTITTDRTQDFTLWYFEHGGGAVCTLGWLIYRADGSGYFTSPTSTNFVTTTTIQDPVLVEALNSAQQILSADQSTLNTYITNKTNVINNISTISLNKESAIVTLNYLQDTATVTLQTANSLADTATVAVQTAITAMDNAVQVTNDYYAKQAALKAQAEALAAQQAAAAAKAAAAKAEADAKAAADAAAKAEADAKAAADAAAKAEADAKAAADAKAKADQAAADQAAKDAQAKADAAKAEADAKAAAKAAADQAAKDAQAKADAAKAEADAKAKAELDAKKIAEIGVVPNNPDQLSDTEIKEAPVEILVPHIQEDKSGVENGGIQFFGTKSAPQVVGEDGKLTPPAPPPGSGLPIPADAITTKDTFIGQPGGTTFNSPDIAVPVILVPLQGAIASVPGAEALNQAFVAMSNIGNDMSPVTRKKAKKILVLTIAVSAVARRRF